MPTKNVDIKINVNSTKANKAFGKIESSVKNIAVGLGAALGSQQIVQFGLEAVRLSARVEGVERAFTKLNNPYLLDNLRLATRNTISDFELMKISMRASNFKIPLGELSTLLEFAQKRASQTGESVDYLVNSIVDGIGRKSTLVLDNLGISATELQKEVRTVGDFGLATGNIVRRELAKMGEVAETTADKFAQINAELDNMKVKIGDVLLETVDVSKDILDWWYNGPGIIYKQLISLITSGNAQTLKMISPHKYNTGNNQQPMGWVDPRTAVGATRRSQKGYDGSGRQMLDYITEQAFKSMISSIPQKRSRGDYTKGDGALLGLDTTFSQLNAQIGKQFAGITGPSGMALSENDLREKFREFDVIANESARTLYQVFSQAWDDIFGRANSVFEMLLQNISMGLMDLVAQDVSSSIFSSIIPGGGGILSGIGSFLGLNKNTTLVQIGDTQLQEATTKVMPNAVSSLKRKRVNI